MLLLSLAITTIVIAIALWRPPLAAAAIILLWPAYLLRTTIAGIPTTALELSLYGALAALIVRLGLRQTIWHWIRLPRDTWWLLSGWGLAWLLATYFAADRHAALGALKAWWADPLLFMGFLIIAIRAKTERHIIINAAILGGVIVALAGLIQLVFFRSTLQEGRLSSFFAPVANYAAMFIGPLLVMSVSLLLHGQRTAWRWISSSIMALAIILTMSFGAYLAVAAGILFSWIYLPSGALKKRLAVAGLAVGLIAGLALSQTKNFSQHFNFDGRSSGSVREQIWVTSWALIKQHPVVGVGPNNFEVAYRAELPKHYFPPLEWLVAQPHNLYLALWLETGLLGLIVFGWLVWHHFHLGLRQFLHAPEHRNIALASLAGIIVILVHGLVDTTVFKNDLAMELALFVALPWLGEVITKVNPKQ